MESEDDESRMESRQEESQLYSFQRPEKRVRVCVRRNPVYRQGDLPLQPPSRMEWLPALRRLTVRPAGGSTTVTTVFQ